MDGRILEFKPGLYLLARKADVPIVPVVIDGAYEAWPRTSPVPRPLMPIHVMYGEPVLPESFKKIPAGGVCEDDSPADGKDAG